MKSSDKDVLTWRIAERLTALFQNKRTGENIPHIILFKEMHSYRCLKKRKKKKVNLGLWSPATLNYNANWIQWELRTWVKAWHLRRLNFTKNETVVNSSWEPPCQDLVMWLDSLISPTQNAKNLDVRLTNIYLHPTNEPHYC